MNPLCGDTGVFFGFLYYLRTVEQYPRGLPHEFSVLAWGSVYNRRTEKQHPFVMTSRLTIENGYRLILSIGSVLLNIAL